MCKLCKYLKRKERDLADSRRVRRLDLKAKYNLTLQDFDAMLAEQQGKCAICESSERNLVVDHHHATGRVRRLLCDLCNTMIGYAREDPAILLAGAAYLCVHEAPGAAATEMPNDADIDRQRSPNCPDHRDQQPVGPEQAHAKRATTAPRRT